TIPVSLNDGALWAGRGLNLALTAGGRVELPHLSVVLAPSILSEQNRVFPILVSGSPARSDFASPWHSGLESADLPLRFGDASIHALDFGQSKIEASFGPVGFGASTENQWWGPGVRNAIVMSNNAAGIPELFIRTSHPIATPIGSVEARWIAGALTK